MLHDDYWFWLFFIVGLIIVVLASSLSQAMTIADCALR